MKRMRKYIAAFLTGLMVITSVPAGGQAVAIAEAASFILDGLGKILEVTKDATEMKQILTVVKQLRDASKTISTYGELVADMEYLTDYFQSTHKRLENLYDDMRTVSNISGTDFTGYASALRSYYRRTESMVNMLEGYLGDVRASFEGFLTNEEKAKDEAENAVQTLDGKIKDCIELFDNINGFVDDMNTVVAIDYQSAVVNEASGTFEQLLDSKSYEEQLVGQNEEKTVADSILSIVSMILGFLAVGALAFGAFRYFTSDSGSELFFVKYVVFLLGAALFFSFIKLFI